MRDYQVIEQAYNRLVQLGENPESHMMKHLLAIGKSINGFRKTQVLNMDFDSVPKAIKEHNVLIGKSVLYCEENNEL